MGNTTFWVGREPSGYEAKVFHELYAVFEQSNSPCHLMVNFIVNGREIDLLVVKPNGIFLVELKMATGVVTGAINGEWTVEGENQPNQLKGGCNGNPYQQMLAQYRAVTEWMESNRQLFLSEYSTKVTHFRADKKNRLPQPPSKIRSLLAFYPDLPKGSALILDWKVEPVSFKHLSQILVNEGSLHVNLNDDEIVAMASALNLQRWNAACVPITALVEVEQLAVQRLELVGRPALFLQVKPFQHLWPRLELLITEALIGWLIQKQYQLESRLQSIRISTFSE